MPISSLANRARLDPQVNFRGGFVLVIVVMSVAALAAALVYARVRGIVYAGWTAAGWTVVHDDVHVMGERVRVLDVAHTYQSATYLDDRWADPVFPYHWLFDHMFDAWPDGDGPREVAVLGGGGYAIPKHLLAHFPQVARLDVIEIDPAIEHIARRHFFLDRAERLCGIRERDVLHTHIAEASTWLRECNRSFDAIVNDCFFGLAPERKLLGSDAARLIREHLNPGGVYLTNVVSALEGPDSQLLYETMDALGSTFAHVWVYPCGSNNPAAQENNVVIASDVGHDFAGAWKWPVR